MVENLINKFDRKMPAHNERSFNRWMFNVKTQTSSRLLQMGKSLSNGSFLSATYVLVSYKWVTVDHNGSTQLHIKFDTMLCE